MKYYVYAKILGEFLPEAKVVKINDCKIEKDQSYSYFLRDIPQIPVHDAGSLYHTAQQGLRSFIQFPQKPISTRYFESDHLISTLVGEDNLHRVIEIAEERFTKTAAILSLAIKTTLRKANKRRIYRKEYYDFEIIGVFVKNGKRLVRIKIPDPAIAQHNYFPQPFPPRLIAKAKKILLVTDPTFQKGLGYIIEASRMQNSGGASRLEVFLNFIKCIELISQSVGIPKVEDKRTKKLRKPYISELFELAGRKLRVKRKNWKFAKQAWNVRSKGDVAHPSIWDWRDFSLSYNQLDEAANDYLLRYLKWL